MLLVPSRIYKMFVLISTVSRIQTQEYCRDFIDLTRRGVDVHTACPFDQDTQTKSPEELICCAYWSTPKNKKEHSHHYNRQKRGLIPSPNKSDPIRGITANSSKNRLIKTREAAVDIDGIPWNLKTYCCNEYERCCGGTCCLKEETCCKDDHGNTTVQCCSAGCCKNSRGELACCPEFTRQMLTILTVILFLYIALGIKRAVRVYCNVRPVHLDEFSVLDEKHIKKMSYLFC